MTKIKFPAVVVSVSSDSPTMRAARRLAMRPVLCSSASAGTAYYDKPCRSISSRILSHQNGIEPLEKVTVLDGGSAEAVDAFSNPRRDIFDIFELGMSAAEVMEKADAVSSANPAVSEPAAAPSNENDV